MISEAYGMKGSRRGNFLLGSSPDFPKGIAVEVVHREVGSMLCIVEKGEIEHKLPQTLRRESAQRKPPRPGPNR